MTMNMKTKNVTRFVATLLNMVTNGEKLSKTLRLFIEFIKLIMMQTTMQTTLEKSCGSKVY